MKSKEELNALKNKVETLNKKFALLPDDALQQVTGGYSEPSTTDMILRDMSNWLDANPNATKSEVYSKLKTMIDENMDRLTPDELAALNGLLKAFEFEEI